MPEPRTGKPLGWLLLLIVGLAPLPFGAEGQWAWSLLAVATGTTLIVWAVLAAAGPQLTGLPADAARLVPASGLYILVLLWIALQASPWTPADWHAEVWSQAAVALGRPEAGAVSINPSDTLSGLARLICYGGVFFVAVLAAASIERAVWLLRGIVAIALAYALYGLVNELLGLDRVLWLTKWRDIGHVSATLLDRNAFATFAGLGLLAGLTLLFLPKLRRDDLSLGRRAAIRNFLDYFFTRSWRSMAATGILFAAVVLTHSRAGLAAAAAGIAVFVFFATRRWGVKPVLLTALAVCLGAGVIFAVSGGGTIERMHLAPEAAAERGEVYRLTAQAIAADPLLGTGHRTFAEAFAAYRSETLQAPFLHGHNMYLETALELGLPAAAALFGAVAWLAAICLRGRRRLGRNAALPCLGLSATALVGVHSLTDSTLRIPAVAILFSALMGIASACAILPVKPGRGSRRPG